MGKEKEESQTEKKKGEEQIATEAPVVLIGLRLTKPEVEKPEEAATGAGKPKKVVMKEGKTGKATIVGARELASLSSPTFLLSLAFLLSSAFSAFRQAFFLAFNKCF